MGIIYYDTESVGFCGPAVLIQWSEDDGRTINLFEPWREPIYETIKLIDKMMTNP